MNLLPENEKMKIEREVKLRFLLAIFLVLIFLGGIGILVLSPSYIIIRGQHEALIRDVDQLRQNVSGKGNVEDELAAYSTEIHTFLSGVGIARYTPSSLIAELLNARPDGVSTSMVSYSRNGENGAVQLTGKGATREALLDYQKKLRNLAFVKEVHYSESFLIRKVDIAYVLTVAIK